MSLADIVTSMQQIQAQLAQLQGLSAPSAAASSASAANAGAFADALTGATAASDVAPADGAGTPVASGTGTGQDVVREAMKYIGTPYVLGGNSKSGIDCSGLVQQAFAAVGVKVGRQVHDQQKLGQPVASLKDAKPGDLIVTDGGNHISIYAGKGMVVHAPYEGRTVSYQKMWFTDKDVVTIRRLVPSEATPAAAPSTTLRAASLGGSSASLSSLLSSIGASGTASTSTTQQLLAARAALLQGAA